MIRFSVKTDSHWGASELFPLATMDLFTLPHAICFQVGFCGFSVCFMLIHHFGPYETDIK